MIEGIAAVQHSGRVLSVGCEVVTEKNLPKSRLTGSVTRQRQRSRRSSWTVCLLTLVSMSVVLQNLRSEEVAARMSCHLGGREESGKCLR